MILFAGDNSGVLFISSASGGGSTFVVAETVPAPAQFISASTLKKKSGGAWAYYPPIYAIRTRGNQTAPAPIERARGKFNIAIRESIAIIDMKPEFMALGWQVSPAPYQSGRVKSHREVKAMRQEEQDILALLASL